MITLTVSLSLTSVFIEEGHVKLNNRMNLEMKKGTYHPKVGNKVKSATYPSNIILEHCS